MNKNEKKTESVKIRLTQTEFYSIQQIALKSSSSISSVIRSALFDRQTDFGSSIKSELIKQKIYNLIQHTKMPKASRENLIKELNRHDTCRH